MTAAPRLPASLPGSGTVDADLLAAIANGNLEALGELFDRHEPEVRRYLGRLGVAPCDVDDLIQTTFLEVVRAASRFEPTHSARGWLFGVATIMLRRHRRSVGRALARIAAWTSASVSEPRPATPAELLESHEATRKLERAFERLSRKKREVFVLVTLEGLSGEEASRALDIPVNTVWTRLHHARLELRAALGEPEGGHGR